MGGLVLVCVCFFLPFCRSCSDDFTPSQGHILSIPIGEDFSDPVLADKPYLAAVALVGLAAAVAVLRRWRWGRVTAGVVLTLYLALILVDAALYAHACMGDSSWDNEGVRDLMAIFLSMSNPYLLAFALVGLLLLASLSRRRRWRRAMGKTFTVFCFAFLTTGAFLLGNHALMALDSDHEETLLYAMMCVIGVGVACGVWFVTSRKTWRWRSAILWTCLAVCLFNTAHILWWEWAFFRTNDARYGLHLTTLGFVAATAGFWLQLLHLRATQHWTLIRWHASRMRSYNTLLTTGAT